MITSVDSMIVIASSPQRSFRDRVIRWQDAYAHRGVGSARDRRRDVQYIYSEAAPVPGQIADPPSNEFVREIRILIRDSVERQVAAGRIARPGGSALVRGEARPRKSFRPPSRVPTDATFSRVTAPLDGSGVTVEWPRRSWFAAVL